MSPLLPSPSIPPLPPFLPSSLSSPHAPHPHSLYQSPNISQQHNGSDCGVFMSQFMFCMAFGRDFDFSQVNMPYFRRRIALDCVAMALDPEQ